MAAGGFVFSGAVSVREAVDAFRSLQTVISGLDLPSLEPAELQSLTAGVRDGQEILDRVLIRIGVIADAQDAEGRGRGAQATMLGDGSRVRGRTARKEADRARTAADMPGVGDAVDAGRIGAAQIDAITQAAKDLSPEQQQQLDTEDLIDAAESLPADTFARRVRDAAERIKGDHGLADTKARQARSSWKHWIDKKTGMGRISAEFDPERHEAIAQAVEAHMTRLANQGGVPKSSHTAATAAFELLTGKTKWWRDCRFSTSWSMPKTLRHGAHPASVRETAAGHPLPPESVTRLACDAVLQRVVLDKRGIPVDVGRKYRTATDAQWAALRSIYRTCAWKVCDRPLSWCQAHHIHEWEHDGVTDLCNLIPLCNHHHHSVHEGGWKVKLDPSTRRLDMYDPDRVLWGSSMPDRPQPPGRGPAQPEGP